MMVLGFGGFKKREVIKHRLAEIHHRMTDWEHDMRHRMTELFHHEHKKRKLTADMPSKGEAELV